jgi:serine/threonine-protein kinase RsbW
LIRPSNEKYILVLISEPRQILKVEGFLEKLKKTLRLNEAQFNRLLVATTEAVNNSIIHGNKRDARKKVVLTCELRNSVIIVRVDDEGSGVNLQKLPDPLAEENLLRENGRGVFLMRSMMDSVEFEKTKEGSAVVMRMTLA